MKVLKNLATILLFITQTGFATTSSGTPANGLIDSNSSDSSEIKEKLKGDLRAQIAQKQNELDQLNFELVSGKKASSEGKQFLVFTGGLAVYFLSKGYVKQHSVYAAAKATGFAALAETAVIAYDADLYNEAMSQKRSQLMALKYQLNELNKVQESDILVGEQRDQTKQRIEILEKNIATLQNLPDLKFSKQAGRHIVVALLTTSAALYARAFKSDILKTFGAALLSFTAGEGIVIYLDSEDVRAAINDLNFELIDLRQKLVEIEAK